MTPASLRLEKLQAISVATRLAAMACAVVQGVIVLRSLGPERYGILGVAVAVAALVGAAQHLGLGVGTLKASARYSTNPEHLSRLIPCALILRVGVTLPAATALFAASSIVATRIYDEPRLATLLGLGALTLIFTNVNEATDSILNGMQRFRDVFLLRTAAAVLLLVAVGSSTLVWGVVGYFAATLGTSALTSLAYLIVVGIRLGRPMRWPTRSAWKTYTTPILSTSLFIYLAQFGETAFFHSGVLYIGQVGSVDDVSFLKLAIGTSMYLMTVSGAINSVSLPLFTSAMTNDHDNYAQHVTANFRSVWMLLILVGAAVIAFSREVVLALAGSAYLPAARILPLTVASVIFFSGYTLLGAKVFLPKNDDRAYAAGFLPIVLLTLLSGALLESDTRAVGWGLAMLVGAGTGFGLAVRRCDHHLGSRLMDARLVCLTGILLFAMACTYFVEPVWLRILLFTFTIVMSPYPSAVRAFVRWVQASHAVRAAGGES